MKQYDDGSIGICKQCGGLVGLGTDNVDHTGPMKFGVDTFAPMICIDKDQKTGKDLYEQCLACWRAAKK